MKIVTSDLHMWYKFEYITVDFTTKITTYVSNMLIILPWPRVSFHIDKTNNLFFQKVNSFFNLEIIIISIIYYNIMIWVIKLFRV
jgi:hypothetical protein